MFIGCHEVNGRYDMIYMFGVWIVGLIDTHVFFIYRCYIVLINCMQQSMQQPVLIFMYSKQPRLFLSLDAIARHCSSTSADNYALLLGYTTPHGES